MLDLKFIRENPEAVKTALKNRNLSLDIDELLSLDKQRREKLSEVEELKRQRNLASEEMAELVKKKADVNERRGQLKELSQKIKELDQKVGEIEEKIQKFVLSIPNIPHESVPIGPDASANKEVGTWGEGKQPDFAPRTHIELGEFLNILDFGRATKISGSNFTLFFGAGAALERALINFMLGLHVEKHGYIEVSPPLLVNRASMIGTGQLPKLEEDMYKLPEDDLFLIPTAEVPVTNVHRDDVLEESVLPVYYTAYTPCFRREAGSYGKDTRGLVRVHQFDKVEMVKFVKPENSYAELEKLLKDAEEVLRLLKLPYRIISLSTGDISFSAAKCYDIEAWAAGIGKWLEVSSCSNFEDFQARRANIRYRTSSGKLEYVHTLNGSGVALARTVIAIMENYQQKDGSIVIPDVLRPFMNNQEIIEPRA